MTKKDLQKEVKPFQYIWSDQHWGHKRILEYSKRPFKDLEDMTEQLIANYNSVVGPNDTCLWLGDCFFCGTEKAKEIMGRLQGKKILVVGNHDRNKSQMLKLGFDFVVDEMVLGLRGSRARFSHFPYWPKWYEVLYLKYKKLYSTLRYKDRRPPRVKGEILVHGHTHSDKLVNYKNKTICVCVEATEYKPLPIEKLEQAIDKIRQYHKKGSK